MFEMDSEEVARLVEDLVTAVRLDSGVIAVQRQVVSVREAIDAVLGTAYCDRAQKLEGHGEPMTAVADGMRVRQTLRNLMCNAVIHGGDRAWISAAQREGSCLIAVSDNGPGVAPHIEDRVFDPYVRARRTQAPQPAIGIGLAVSRDLAPT